MRRLIILLSLWLPLLAAAAPATPDGDAELESHINEMKEPLYSPFIERYLLD